MIPWAGRPRHAARVPPCRDPNPTQEKHEPSSEFQGRAASHRPVVLPLAQAVNLSKADYKAGKTRIAADYKLDHSACASLAGNAKDICDEQAKGKQKVATAELEYGHSASAGNHARC